MINIAYCELTISKSNCLEEKHLTALNHPSWLNTAFLYEIYPQSFKDTNADGIGDFQGIIDSLDYIKDLGCDAIWLNLCFESPFGDAFGLYC